jgi:hypothetical protein
MIDTGAEFIMEVTDKTKADVKVFAGLALTQTTLAFSVFGFIFLSRVVH